MQTMKISRRAAAFLISFGLIVHSIAGTPGIAPANFLNPDTAIIWAETIETRPRVLAVVVPRDRDPEAEVALAGAVELPYELTLEVIGPRGAPAGVSEIMAKHGNDPSISEEKLDALLAELERKAEAEWKQKKAEYQKALAAAGLNHDPETEAIAHFLQGEATLRVIRSFSPSVKPGEKIRVSWLSRFRVSCPPIYPVRPGKALWEISAKGKACEARGVHGFHSSLDDAIQAHDEASSKAKND